MSVLIGLYVFWLCYVYWVVCTALDDLCFCNSINLSFLFPIFYATDSSWKYYANSVKKKKKKYECQFTALLFSCSIECGFELNWPRPTGSCIEITGSRICWFTIQTNSNEVFGNIIKVNLLNIKMFLKN